MSEVRVFLVEFIADELEIATTEVRDSSELIRDLGFDSLAFASTVSEIASRFGVRLSKDDVFESKTVGALVELVESRKSAPDVVNAAVNASGNL
ncbi:acyl carrier protein [Mycobacterium ulcerans]|uniref:acyl carrier protein n=1 Tax=Mycobacterium ulcerans TaxID=1809 RepID=UPI00106B761D|nr:acyl carrier protein [Mycobacterium ulcerans]